MTTKKIIAGLNSYEVTYVFPLSGQEFGKTVIAKNIETVAKEMCSGDLTMVKIRLVETDVSMIIIED